MAGFQLPFGVKPVNAVPVDYYSGPYISIISIEDAIEQANLAIPQGIRFKTMEVRLIVNGIGVKYWYRDGVDDINLVEFTTSTSFYLQGGTTYSSDTTSNIYRTGAVNIGSNATSSSDAKLYVSSNQPGAFRLEDGTQGPGYLLTSDINGVAGWTVSNYLTIASASFYIQGGTLSSFDTTSDIYRTGSLTIGTSSYSTSKLHVYSTQSGALQLEDGSQGDSYILTSDENGVASWTASVPFLTGSYSLIRTLLDNSQLIPEKQYVIIDYVHKYYIENTNTSNIKTFKTVTSIVSNFIILDNNYEYNLTLGMTIRIESLPIGYSGSLIVGQTTTVSQVASNYYFKFANGMNNTTTSIGVVISFGLPRFTTLTGLTGTTVSDVNSKVVMKPGGVLNTDVHDGTIYGDMSALENFAPTAEKLLLRARTSNTFYEEAESLTFKNDKVIYDINDSDVLNDNLEVISTRNGFISRRFNDVLGIDIDKDWRAQKYRRWLLPTEYRSNVLNLTLGTSSSLNSHQGKYLYTSELVGTASNSYMYLGKSLETTDITLGASGSVSSYGITFSTNQINFKDYPIFKLDSNWNPVGVSKVKVNNLSNTVFIGNNTNFNYDLYLEIDILSMSTFQGNIIFYGNNIRLTNINALYDINITGSFIKFNNVNFLSTVNSEMSDTDIDYAIFGSMKYNTFLSGYGGLPLNTPVRWFTIFIYNSTIGYSVIGCGFSTLNLSYCDLNGITLFKYCGTLDIKNTKIGDFTIANNVQYKSLLVQDYFIKDSKLLNKDISVTSNISGFIAKTDKNGILCYESLDIITGLTTKFYYNDTTKLYTKSINGGEVISTSVNATASVVVYDYSLDNMWYHGTASSNFTANFTNLPTTDNRVLSTSIIISQGLNAYIPNIVQIEGVTQSVKWPGGTQSGTSYNLDIVTFNFIRTGATWSNVIGQVASFT